MTILLVVVVTLAVRAVAGVPLLGALWLHIALLLGYVALVWALRHFRAGTWTPVVRALAVVAVMFTLYATLGFVAFRAIPWLGDPLLADLDRTLFLGTAPVLWMEAHVTPGRVDAASFVYALFIPYLYMSIFLGLVGRPDREREEFITGFAILYAVSFLGYLFVPARGPIVHHAADFAAPLDGGFFHHLVVSSIDRSGGPHGAFPSLHVGASCYACLFDLRSNRLRGMTYLPLVLLIAVSTVVLRYHYVVDLLAGAAFAALAVAAARACRFR